ncbi:MAG: hypothetical protein AMJ95_10295 [Omnitrophica WOR_2 bacterium SM23_72]|nr:MAG: hypothetical protein AMJ95_10295 [Omnitrophica WOR_2 bacterium SM23_72]
MGMAPSQGNRFQLREADKSLKRPVRRSGQEGGLDLPESIQMARAMQEAGADYLSVSHGCYGATTWVFPDGADAITGDASVVRKGVSIPVMCPNFQDPDKAAGAIANASVDLVALSRALRRTLGRSKRSRKEGLRRFNAVSAAISAFGQ